jgi:hypothetical protein
LYILCATLYIRIRRPTLVEEIEFTLNGKRYKLSRAMVIKAMSRQTPGRIQMYAVDIEGVLYPVKQALASALQIPVTDFVSTRAHDILSKLEFTVINVEENPVLEPQVTDKLAALQLAVQLYAGTGTVGSEIVMAAAHDFAAFLQERPA